METHYQRHGNHRNSASHVSLEFNKRKLPNISSVRESKKRKVALDFKLKLRGLIHSLLKSVDIEKKIVKCGNAVLWNRSEVEIIYRTDLKKATFRHVLMCKKGWICPVCANKLAIEKREELLELQSIVNNRGLNAYLMTLTIPHTKQDSLEDLLEKLAIVQRKFLDALNRAKAKRTFSKLGHIAVLEVTYSEQGGWHPHLHILVISEKDYSPNELKLIEQELYVIWSSKCKLSGVKVPHRKYAVTLINCASDKEKLDIRVIYYLIKHGLIKHKSRDQILDDIKVRKGVTIWDIAQLASDKSEQNAQKYRWIIQEYALAMVKKHFVSWSDLLLD